jgi:hypothetical protein
MHSEAKTLEGYACASLSRNGIVAVLLRHLLDSNGFTLDYSPVVNTVTV